MAGIFATAEMPEAQAAYRKTVCDKFMSYGSEGMVCLQANGGSKVHPTSFKIYRTVVPMPWATNPKTCRVGAKLWFVYPNGRRHEEYSHWSYKCHFGVAQFQCHWGFKLPLATLVCGGWWSEHRNRTNKAVRSDGHACYRV